MPELMQPRLARQSALARYWGNNDHASVLAGNVAIRELVFLGVVKLQCRRPSAEFLAVAEAALGFELPVEPNTLSGDERCALWVAPNEWLLITPAGDDEALARELADLFRQRIPDANTTVNLISDSLVALAVEGAAAADLIAKGCGLNLRPASFPVGRCASSLLEQVPFVLYPREAGIAYRLLVDRSYAAFTWDWLCHAAREFEFYP